MLALPVFKFPTTLMWLDDDALFLKAITIFFQEHTIKSFSNPLDGLNFIKTYNSPLSKTNFLRGCIQNDAYDMILQSPVNLDISTLTNLYKEERKSEEISIIIVDYNMPNMNGIEFCQTLQGLPIKRILLTGVADYKAAIFALNNNIIDCFIQKDSPTLYSDVNSYIEKLNTQFFNEKTSGILSHLEADNLSALSDSKFINFFNTWCETNNIREYYLASKNGGFLLINDKKEKFLFLVETDYSIDNFIDIYNDEACLTSLIRHTKERKLIPFFPPSIDPVQIDFIKWKDYFIKPKMICGNIPYYYHVADQNSIYFPN